MHTHPNPVHTWPAPHGPAKHFRQDNTHTHTLRHTHQGLSLSSFTLSITVKMNVSTLWLRGRGKKKWKGMCQLTRGRGKIPNRAVSLSTSCCHPYPGPEPDQRLGEPQLPCPAAPTPAPRWQAWGSPCRKGGPQMNWSHLWPKALAELG